MGAESDIRSAEVRKVEAERHKLELESKEIERRLSKRWWEGARFPQYLVAIVITSALLFGWARAYLEPILRREAEVNTLTERRNATLNALLEAKNERLSVESSELGIERDKLREQADRLTREARELKAEQQTLKGGVAQLTTESQTLRRGMVELTIQRNQLVKEKQTLRTMVTGLIVMVDQMEKGDTNFFILNKFSILNKRDPINKLEDSYGWEIWSDNRLSRLGYYLRITHPDVLNGEEVIVGRVFEIDDIKNDLGSSWQEYIAKVNEYSPLLALDYTYLGLVADEQAPVGGMLYMQGGQVIKFHAPLNEWAKDLGAALANE